MGYSSVCNPQGLKNAHSLSHTSNSTDRHYKFLRGTLRGGVRRLINGTRDFVIFLNGLLLMFLVVMVMPGQMEEVVMVVMLMSFAVPLTKLQNLLQLLAVC